MIETRNFIYTMRDLKKALRGCRSVADVNIVRAVMRPGRETITVWQRIVGGQFQGKEVSPNGRWLRKCHKREREVKQ